MEGLGYRCSEGGARWRKGLGGRVPEAAGPREGPRGRQRRERGDVWVRSDGRGGGSPGPARLEQVCSEVGGPGGLDQKRNTVVPGSLVRGCAEAMAERRRRGEWASVLEKEGNGGLEELVGGLKGWLAWCHD